MGFLPSHCEIGILEGAVQVQVLWRSSKAIC
jgi:hypothetical protein